MLANHIQRTCYLLDLKADRYLSELQQQFRTLRLAGGRRFSVSKHSHPKAFARSLSTVFLSNSAAPAMRRIMLLTSLSSGGDQLVRSYPLALQHSCNCPDQCKDSYPNKNRPAHARPSLYDLYGLTPSFCTCSVNSRTTCANLGPSAAETHSRRKRSSSIPKSVSISLMASARFSVLRLPS